MNYWSIIFIMTALASITEACQPGDKFSFTDEHTECHVYYLCDDGKLIEKYCPIGMVYDSFHNQCTNNSGISCSDTPSIMRILKRGKRQASAVLRDFMEPLFSKVMEGLRNFFTFEEKTLTTKIVLPTIFEMAGDAETRFYLKRIMWDLKAAYAPLMSDLLRQQTWNTPNGTRIAISKELLIATGKKIREIKPLVKKVILKHGRNFFYRAGDNIDIVVDTIERFQNGSSLQMEILVEKSVEFLKKHGGEFLTSFGSGKPSVYAFKEIEDDLRPIEGAAFQLFMQYLSQSSNPLISWAYNPNSFILRTVFESDKEVYAVPKNSAKI